MLKINILLQIKHKTLAIGDLDNYITKPLIITESDTNVSGEEKTYTIFDLIRTPNLRKITFCLCSLWFVYKNYI